MKEVVFALDLKQGFGDVKGIPGFKKTNKQKQHEWSLVLRNAKSRLVFINILVLMR